MNLDIDPIFAKMPVWRFTVSAFCGFFGMFFMLFGFQSQWDWAPMLWEVEYEAGIDENDPLMPLALLKETVFKRASMGILSVWGERIYESYVA